MKPFSTTWPRRCQVPLSHHVVEREFLESVLLTTACNFLVVCCHVPLNVCAEVVESSVGSENPAAFTNPLPPHAARTSPLPSNLRIFQSEQLNPAARPTPRRLAGNRCNRIVDELAVGSICHSASATLPNVNVQYNASLWDTDLSHHRLRHRVAQ